MSAFGKPAHPRTIAVRTLEEMAELLKAMDEFDHDDPKVYEEIADVAICLSYLAESVGCHIGVQVDRKMAINRSREWVADGRGNGYHKK